MAHPNRFEFKFKTLLDEVQKVLRVMPHGCPISNNHNRKTCKESLQTACHVVLFSFTHKLGFSWTFILYSEMFLTLFYKHSFTFCYGFIQIGRIYTSLSVMGLISVATVEQSHNAPLTTNHRGHYITTSLSCCYSVTVMGVVCFHICAHHTKQSPKTQCFK